MRRTIARAPTHSPQGSWAYCTPKWGCMAKVLCMFCCRKAANVGRTQQTRPATPPAAPLPIIGKRQLPASSRAVAGGQQFPKAQPRQTACCSATTIFAKALDKRGTPHNGPLYAEALPSNSLQGIGGVEKKTFPLPRVPQSSSAEGEGGVPFSCAATVGVTRLARPLRRQGAGLLPRSGW